MMQMPASIGARGAEQVARHGLGRADGEFVGVLAEDALHGQRLQLVVHRSGGAMGVDVVDVVTDEARLVREHVLHGAGGAFALFVRHGDVEGVAGGAIAGEFGEDVRAAREGVLFGFEHEHARAFADDEPIAGEVEGAGGSARVGRCRWSARARQRSRPWQMGVIAASVPPARAISASPRRMMFAASPMLSAPLAQALTRQ